MITYLKSHSKALSGYEIDLSNKVLTIDFDQKAAKISEVKVGG